MKQQIPLVAKPVTPHNFAAYGQVIQAQPDGKGFDEEDAQLVLDRGTPR